MTTDDTKYNGWTNYDTWKLSLNIDNDEESYTFWRKEVQRKELDWKTFKEYLEDWIINQNTYEVNCLGYKLSDFWSFREWEEINFQEILTSLKEPEE